MDAIIKIGQYIEHANRDAEIMLMCLSKAIGAINKKLLWATLCMKGPPVETIKHIGRGHRRTKLVPKYIGKYGELSENNIWIFQGSAIDALLFIIYMGDVMEENAALGR